MTNLMTFHAKNLECEFDRTKLGSHHVQKRRQGHNHVHECFEHETSEHVIKEKLVKSNRGWETPGYVQETQKEGCMKKVLLACH